MVHRSLHGFPWAELDVFFIENVGNLVCPAIYDLGQAANVVVLSVTEGEDKPLKYPVMFQKADLVLVTKADLVPHLDVEVARIKENLARVMPDPRVLLVSARTGLGMAEWKGWVEGLRARGGSAKRPATLADGHAHDHDHGGAHDHDHGHTHAHRHPHAHEHVHEHAHGGKRHAHPHVHEHAHGHAHAHDHDHGGAHDHGDQGHAALPHEHGGPEHAHQGGGGHDHRHQAAALRKAAPEAKGRAKAKATPRKVAVRKKAPRAPARKARRKAAARRKR
jgi:hypothetical protein